MSQHYACCLEIAFCSVSSLLRLSPCTRFRPRLPDFVRPQFRSFCHLFNTPLANFSYSKLYSLKNFLTNFFGNKCDRGIYLINILLIQLYFKNGERGIRTLGEVTPSQIFEICTLNRSDISPFIINYLRHFIFIIHTVLPSLDCFTFIASL